MKNRWHDDVGITCSTCGAACSRIVERRDSRGYSFRTRVCDANKLHRFTTAEIVIGNGMLAHEARKFMRRAEGSK